MLLEDVYHDIQKSVKIPNDIKNLNLKEINKLLLHNNFNKCISGKRLTSTGIFIFDILYTLYKIETDINLSGRSIVVLSNMLSYPWGYDGKNIYLMDKKIVAEIKLKLPFSNFIKSEKTKKHY